jgi:hypothetical protein
MMLTRQDAMENYILTSLRFKHHYGLFVQCLGMLVHCLGIAP